MSRLLSSEVREITTESGDKRFLVHEDLLASQSEYLRNLTTTTISNDEGNSAQRQINIGSWDTETVGRFVEYVYTGDYYCPDPEQLATPVATPPILERGAEDEVQSIRELTAILSSPEQSQDKITKERGSASLESSISSLEPLAEFFRPGPDPPRRFSAAEQFTMKHFDPTVHDFKEVFLTHAKIYALALKLKIEALCTLALQRLVRTLLNIGSVQLSSSVPGNFVELARYTYSHTHDTRDPLREVVSHFAALSFTALQTKEMEGLISEGGDFAKDLMQKVNIRLIAAERIAHEKVGQETEANISGMLSKQKVQFRLKSREYESTIKRLRKAHDELKAKLGALRVVFERDGYDLAIVDKYLQGVV